MRSLLISALLPVAWLVAASGHAQVQDPLKSEGCGAALASLQAARSGGAAAADVERERAAAAAACLGTAVRPDRPSRTVQAPVVVPPPRIEVPPAAAAPRVPPPRLPPPPLAIERAPMPAQCDTAGCWTTGETHLRHVPPSLAGPGGPCLQQGGTVYCP